MKQVRRNAVWAMLVMLSVGLLVVSCMTVEIPHPGCQPDLTMESLIVTTNDNFTLMKETMPTVARGQPIYVVDVVRNLTNTSKQSKVKLYLSRKEVPSWFCWSQHDVSVFTKGESHPFVSVLKVPRLARTGTNYVIAVCGLGICEAPAGKANNTKVFAINAQGNKRGGGLCSDIVPTNGWTSPIHAPTGTYVLVTDVVACPKGNATQSTITLYICGGTNPSPGCMWYSHSVSAMNAPAAVTNTWNEPVPSLATGTYNIIGVCAGGNECTALPDNRRNNTNKL